MRKMKDSGIEWIGEIPASWDTMRLRNHFSFGKGLPITKADLTESGVSVISYGQIHSKANIGTRIKPELIRYVDDKYLDTNDSSLVSKGSFIFADTSEDISGCGNCVYVDVEYPLFAGYHTMILRPENESFTKYYSYLFATDAWRSQIRAQASGVKLFSITQKMLQDTVLIEPSEEEKVRIVDYLDKKCAEIDAIIAAKEKTNELLKERRQSIIYEAVTKGLDPTVPMKDSGIEWIGEIPTHWNTMRLRSKFSFGKGLPITKADLRDSGVSVVSYGQIHSKHNIGTTIKTELIRYVDNVYLDTNASSLVNNGDFIFADTSEDLSGCGNCVYVDTNYPLFAGYHTMILRPIENTSSKYYSYLFATDAWRSQIRAQASGVKLFSITQKMLRDALLIEPSEEEKANIVSFLDDMCSTTNTIIASNEATIEKLKEYRQSVIYEAVTGKVEI